KDEARKEELGSVMVHLAEVLRITAILLKPFITESPAKIFEQFGLDFETEATWEQLSFGQFPAGTLVVKKGTPIFPRLAAGDEVAYLKEQISPKETYEVEEEKDFDPEETQLVSEKEKQIQYDDFDKVELKVAEVIDCQKVEGADKLLKFR